MNHSGHCFHRARLAFNIAAAMAIAAAGNSLAESETLNLDIKSQDAGSALMELASSSGVQIMLSRGAGESVQLSALKGNYTLEKALEMMLSGSGLTYQFTDENVVLITKDAEQNEGKQIKEEKRIDEEILVTATRREENIQDVPISVYALTGQDLEDRSIDEARDLFYDVPGLQISEVNRGSVFIGIRGIRTLTAGTGAGTASVYIDDVPSGTTQLATFDLNRVEVLRGPQGTLFGEGSLAGAIRFITNEPDPDQFSGKLRVNYSSIAHGDTVQSYNGLVNIPLTDNLAVRVSGHTLESEGFIDDVFTGEQDIDNHEIEGGRIVARWQLSDAISITPSYQYQKLNSGPSSNVDLISGTRNFEFGALTTSSAPLGLSISNNEFEQSALVARFDFDSMQLISSSNVHKSEGSTSTGFLNEADILTQEFRLVSTGDGPLEWVAGLFYEDFDSENGAVFGNGFSFGGTTEFKQTALFATVSYHWTDKLTTDFGVRYFEEDLAESTFIMAAPPFDFLNASSEREITESVVTPRFAISYKVSDDIMWYASIAEGFRRGVVNLVFEPTIPEFAEADTLWSYEVGFKARFPDQDITFNTALYYIDWDDIQVFVPILIMGQPTGFNDNFGKAHSTGVEFEFSWQPVNGLNVSFNGSLQQAEFDRDQPDGSARKGDSLPQSPDFHFSSTISYGWSLYNGWDASATLSSRWVDERISRTQAIELTTAESYTLSNLRLGVSSDKWSATLYADNLFNRIAQLQFDARTNNMYLPAQPRTVGLTVDYRF